MGAAAKAIGVDVIVSFGIRPHGSTCTDRLCTPMLRWCQVPSKSTFKNAIDFVPFAPVRQNSTIGTEHLQVDLHTTLIADLAALTQVWQEIGDVVPRMSVQTSAQSLLIQEMRNETNRTTKHEETVQDTHS